MARVKLDIPAPVIATVQIPVRITDINYADHLGNDSLVGIVHEARMLWLKTYGLSELGIQGSVGTIMNDLEVEYKMEGHYGDILTIELSVGEMTRVGFELYYLIKRVDGGIIAKAKTGLVCFDYASKKVQSIPELLKKILTP